jgi:trimethylamine corrinoid protein
MELRTLENLKKAVIDYDAKEAKHWAHVAVDQGANPIDGLDALTEAIQEVGAGFERGDLWLPDLVGAADALQAAMPVFEEEIKHRGAVRETLGTVVIGTVKGDIHTIGKMMVSTFLTAAGFAVYDLGVDVSAQQFMDGVREHKADVLAMSALLTFTAPEQRRTIQALEEAGIRDRVKVIVGGGAITADTADSYR